MGPRGRYLAGMTTRARSQIGFALAVASLVVLVARGALFATGPLSIAIQVVAFLLMAWARIRFGGRSFHASAEATHGPLETGGPFAFVRNPIYAAILLFLAGSLTAYPDLVHAGALGIAALGLFIRIRAEEVELSATYGAEYAAYCARVRRLVPFVY